MSQHLIPSEPAALPPSAAIYNRLLLGLYDVYVIGFSNRWVWRCPSSKILKLYDQQVSGCHLEVGVGTGYFPHHCRFPVTTPIIDLLDIHPAPLAHAARRLARYQPCGYTGDVLQLENRPPRHYQSIAINYLLHCLQGPLLDKGQRVINQLRPLLDPVQGRLFGSTILGVGVTHNALGQGLMSLYNQKGIFGNSADGAAELDALLRRNFKHYQLEVHGCVALFNADRPIG